MKRKYKEKKLPDSATMASGKRLLVGSAHQCDVEIAPGHRMKNKNVPVLCTLAIIRDGGFYKDFAALPLVYNEDSYQ